jgi:hypothetical protein
VKSKWMSKPAASDERRVLRTNHFCLITGCARKRWRNKHRHDISVHIDINRYERGKSMSLRRCLERVVQEGNPFKVHGAFAKIMSQMSDKEPCSQKLARPVCRRYESFVSPTSCGLTCQISMPSSLFPFLLPCSLACSRA